MENTSTVPAPTAEPKRESTDNSTVKPYGSQLSREQALKAGMETYKAIEARQPATQHKVADVADVTPKLETIPDDKQPRAKDGKFAAYQEQTEPKAPEVAEADKAKADAPKTWTTADREKAVTGLRRGQVPEKALASLSEDERVQWGLALAKSQAEGDRRVTEATKAKTSNSADPAPKPAGQPDSRGNLRGLSDELGLGDEGHSKLEAAFLERDAKIAERDTQLEEFRSELRDVYFDRAFSELAKEYPELATEDGRNAVAERAARLADAGDYETLHPKRADQVRECVRDACAIEFRDSIAARQAAREKSARRDAGQPNPPTPGKQTKPLNRKEYAVASMGLLEQGQSPEQVKARLGG